MNPFRDIAGAGPYRVVLADPAWNWKAWSKKGEGRSAKRHYSVMDLEAIKALPVASICAKDCYLFLWVTWPMLEHGLEVIKAWGFTYKTGGFDWMKTSKAGKPIMGTGYHTRANTEPCLLATRGKPNRLKADVPMAILEPRREHSRKPDCIYDRTERLAAGPYVELFARHRRPGWSSWGLEVKP